MRGLRFDDSPFELRLEDGRSLPCRIRVSRRSRRVRLTLTPRDGLVMVTPPGTERAWLTGLAEQWRGWVARQLEALGIEAVEELGIPQVTLPERILLPAIGESWQLLQRYAPGAGPRVRATTPGVLVLSGDCSELVSSARAIERWLMRRAREVLPPMLEALSQETGLGFRAVSVRAQKSRWGSCSSTGDISLNYQILFLTPELARHVLLHELCHTVRLDHSPRFWRTVARFEPDLELRRAEMRRSWAQVPAWLLASR
jgi:hypothetical protein